MKSIGFTAAVTVAAAVVTPAIAWAENVRWFSTQDAEQVSLFYGLPESDHVEIALTCEPGGEQLSFSYSTFDMPEAPDGLDTNVVLAVGTLEYRVPVIGTRIEMDERLVLAGDVTLEPALKRILEGRDVVTVRVEGGPRVDYPRDGLAEAAKPILDSCAPK